jgi:hypothetical protein
MSLQKSLRELVKWDLSKPELLDYGGKLATLEKDLSQLENQKKDIPKQMASIRAKMTSVREALLAGWEWRGVDCFERLSGATVEIVRCDTFEVVRTRTAEQSDVQVTVEEVAAKKAAATTEEAPKRQTLIVGQLWMAATGDQGRVVEVGPDFVDIAWDGDDDPTTYELEEWHNEVGAELLPNPVQPIKGMKIRMGDYHTGEISAVSHDSVTVKWDQTKASEVIAMATWETLGIEIVSQPAAKKSKGKKAAAE